MSFPRIIAAITSVLVLTGCAQAYGAPNATPSAPSAQPNQPGAPTGPSASTTTRGGRTVRLTVTRLAKIGDGSFAMLEARITADRAGGSSDFDNGLLDPAQDPLVLVDTQASRKYYPGTLAQAGTTARLTACGPMEPEVTLARGATDVVMTCVYEAPKSSRVSIETKRFGVIADVPVR